jgi:hypothetical protein
VRLDVGVLRLESGFGAVDQIEQLAMILFKSRWNNAMPVVAPADTLCSRIVRRRELPN